MRKEFKLNEKQLKDLLEACKPVIMIALNAGMPPSPQENANRAWRELGKEMGFDSVTVQPVPGKDVEYFTAIESEKS